MATKLDFIPKPAKATGSLVIAGWFSVGACLADGDKCHADPKDTGEQWAQIAAASTSATSSFVDGVHPVHGGLIYLPAPKTDQTFDLS